MNPYIPIPQVCLNELLREPSLTFQERADLLRGRPIDPARLMELSMLSAARERPSSAGAALSRALSRLALAASGKTVEVPL